MIFEKNLLLAMFLIPEALLNPTKSSDATRKTINSFAGPYIVTVDKQYSCKKEIAKSLQWNITARPTHFNPLKPRELQRATGKVVGTVPINDTWWALLILDTRSNNQWKENAFRFAFPKGGCSVIFNTAPFAKGFFGKLVKQIQPNCEISPGINEYNEMPVPFLFPMVPVMPYMDWRARATMNVAGLTTPALCFIVEGTLVPKH